MNTKIKVSIGVLLTICLIAGVTVYADAEPTANHPTNTCHNSNSELELNCIMNRISNELKKSNQFNLDRTDVWIYGTERFIHVSVNTLGQCTMFDKLTQITMNDTECTDKNRYNRLVEKSFILP